MHKYISLFVFFILLLTSNNIFSEDSVKETEHEFIAFTIPKSGSHLLDCALRLMTGRSNFFFPTEDITSLEQCRQRIAYLKSINRYEMSHNNYSDLEATIRQELNCKILFIIRDPRDTIISFVNWIDKEGHGGPAKEIWDLLERDEKIMFVLENIHGVGMRQFFLNRLSWGLTPVSKIVRFENLVGEKGGGSKEKQMQELIKIADHIGLDATYQDLEYVADNLFGWGSTFFMGQTGVWKNEFTPAITKRCKELLGDILIELEYEADLNWSEEN